MDVQVVALSADDAEDAGKMKEEEELAFPVLWGLDCDDVRDRFGLYIQENERTHLQPAQFILDPDGEIRFASYSNGPVGRLGAEDALEQVEAERS